MPAARPRVLVTRAAQQGSELADHLRALGAEPILIPAIETTDPTSFAPLDAALAHLDHFHWLLFTSANAAEAFANRSRPRSAEETLTARTGDTSPAPQTNRHPERSAAESKDPRVSSARAEGMSPNPTGSPTPRIAAIGPSTARALQKHNLTPHLIPPQAVAESLAEALLPHARQPNGTPTRFLLIRAEEAREHLPETLQAAGAEVTIAPAYRTVIPAGSVDQLREVFRHPDRSAIPLHPDRSATQNCPPDRSATQNCPPDRSATQDCPPDRSATQNCPTDRSATQNCPPDRSATQNCHPERSAAKSKDPETPRPPTTARTFSPPNPDEARAEGSSPSPEPTIRAITFTSSSTARNLLALCEAAHVTLPPDALRISIGPITSQTLRDLGLPPHAEAPEATVAALAQTTLAALRESSR